MIFVIIIAHAAHKSQHNFRFFRPAAADERLPLTRELSAKLTEGEKTLDFCIALKKCKPSGLLSLRQNLRFCHLPRQREALVRCEIAHYALHRTGYRSAPLVCAEKWNRTNPSSESIISLMIAKRDFTMLYISRCFKFF